MSCSALSRSEEHTSELQSRFDLVCRLLLAKKKYTMDKCPLRLSLSTVSSYENNVITHTITYLTSTYSFYVSFIFFCVLLRRSPLFILFPYPTRSTVCPSTTRYR